MRDSEYSYQDEDAPTDAILEKQAQAEVGFTDEDEPGEFQQRLPEEEPARIAPLAEQSSEKKTLSQVEADAFRDQARNSVYAATREAMREDKPSHMALGEYLQEIGCENVAMGTSKLWYKGDGPDSGHWLFIIAVKPTGTTQVQPGYRVTLAFGREKAGQITMEACAFLEALDRNGDELRFEKCNAVKHDGAKFAPDGALSEFDTARRIMNMEFETTTPFSFNE